MYVCTYLYTYIHRCTALLCSVRFWWFHNASYFKQTVVLGNCCHLSSITYVCVCVQRYAYTRYVGPEAQAGQAPTCLLVVSSGGVSSRYNSSSIPWSGSTPWYCSWMQVLSAFLQLTDSYVRAYMCVCTCMYTLGKVWVRYVLCHLCMLHNMASNCATFQAPPPHMCLSYPRSHPLQAVVLQRLSALLRTHSLHCSSHCPQLLHTSTLIPASLCPQFQTNVVQWSRMLFTS